jgi:hypothetical protein
VEGGLLAVVAAIFLSAAVAASYKHPAWLIAWEWLAVLVAFLVVRQMVRTPADNCRLLAAILASGVSLSAYAVYQEKVDFPVQPNVARSGWETASADLGTGPLALESLVQRGGELRRPAGVTATFASPNVFASYLILLLPVMVGWCLVCRRLTGWSWPTFLTALCALAMVIALVLTRSRSAAASALLIGAGVLLWQIKARGIRLRNMIFAVVLAGSLLSAVCLSRWGQDLVDHAAHAGTARWTYWTTTWRMITDVEHSQQFWLGVGPGNLARHFPQYMKPDDPEEITDPHNFLLEMWATSGLLGFLGLVAALALFFKRTRAAWTIPDSAAIPDGEIRTGPRWEFYGGGIAGLILGFTIGMLGRSHEHIFLDGLVAGIRAVIWLAVYALLEAIPWAGPSRCLALVIGIVAFLIHCTVSRGFGYPSLAQPFWLLAALALNDLAPAPVVRPGFWLGRMVPIPLATTICFGYALMFLIPVISCSLSLFTARYYYTLWHNKLQPEWQAKIAGAKEPEKKNLRQDAARFLQRTILDRLREAANRDRDDLDPWIELAYWDGVGWSILPSVEQRYRAASAAQQARSLDPTGKEPLLAQYHLNMLFAGLSETETQRFYELAAKAIVAAAELDPTDPRWHYLAAEVLFKTGNSVEGRHQARKAIELDQQTANPARHLTPQQRNQVTRWLVRASSASG